MLVLAPTRELASQIAASAETYGRFMRLSVGVIFGGVPTRRAPAPLRAASTCSSPRRAACST